MSGRGLAPPHPLLDRRGQGDCPRPAPPTGGSRRHRAPQDPTMHHGRRGYLRPESGESRRKRHRRHSRQGRR